MLPAFVVTLITLALIGGATGGVHGLGWLAVLGGACFAGWVMRDS